MKIGIIGDPHLGCTKYTDKRSSDFSHKFNTAIDECIKRRVDLVVILGDVFDSSSYRRSVDSFASNLQEVASALLMLKKTGIPVFAIAGNHEYGRGRIGGELRILKSLEIVHFLEDEMVDYNGLVIGGISYKSTTEMFKDALKRMGSPRGDSILLIHQFLEGSKFIKSFLVDAGKKDVKGWGMVFAGHHHQYEDMGYAIAPGSLEIHGASEIGQKGLVIYDTASKSHEFIPLPAIRPMSYIQITADGRSAMDFQEEIEKWITANSNEGALLVIKISGVLREGKPSDINWRHLRSLGQRNGCIRVHFDGGLTTEVRTAPEIRAMVNFDDYLLERFGPQGKRAIKYVDSLKDKGRLFSEDLIREILRKAGESAKK